MSRSTCGAKGRVARRQPLAGVVAPPQTRGGLETQFGNFGEGLQPEQMDMPGGEDEWSEFPPAYMPRVVMVMVMSLLITIVIKRLRDVGWEELYCKLEDDNLVKLLSNSGRSTGICLVVLDDISYFESCFSSFSFVLIQKSDDFVVVSAEKA
ncbi:interferon-induced helicase C domain-containing protein 1 [Striga asiatica]|uniref:Interferon-induced helicase C domain-containing protein 1 n=1 Tax=Striga asiatica TaxID=4170 RepID=A0A5A7Q3G0_STRAF|nr:interferon-induced helicase C domain-containing protein 1 [Striga asiatica]